MRLSLAVGLSATLLAASACSALDDESADAVEVAAAFYPLEYVAARIAGEHAEVVALTTPGQEPHDLELTISETADLARADLVVYEADFQAAVDAAIEQNATGEVLDAAAVVGLQPAEGDHEDEDVHTADDGHDHEGGLDPHFWLDPQRMATLGDAVAAALEEIDPEHAADYTSNAAALRTDLETLDEAFEAGLTDCERTTVVVSHDAFGYLARYGVEFRPVAGLSPDAEPSPAGLRELQELIADEGVTTVFSERLSSPKLTQALANDMGVATAILDPIEGLSDETADEDYLSLMEQNLIALQDANACR